MIVVPIDIDMTLLCMFGTITIATGITTYIIEGTGGDRGSLGC